MEPVRINKYLAQCGVCSRREADKLIEDGAVTINRLPAASGQKVTAQDEVAVHGTVITVKEKVVLAYYKPIGVVVTQKDAHAERTVIEEIDYPEHLTYAGRLDKDSEGLLLLTNDGDLIHGIMKGGHFHEKEYEVTLDKAIDDKDLRKLEKGVYLKELERQTRPCKIRQTGPRQVTMVLTQGLNRQIRRMWKSAGYEVLKLKRVRVANVELRGLKPGEYRVLNGAEKEELYRIAGQNRK
ncbi:MAG: rRNA pseudouridine synthase [Lachnospiraceae bacterium]|nr:rRNA pseudouridine synthase [Lachnospiraceae bacterium]